MNDAPHVDRFEVQVSCAYRGEDYQVRDNGAVLRRAKQGTRRRSLDEIWTFGRAAKVSGYMALSGHKVHRIVATAFHGAQPSNDHVVDHIDTNRRNNRPDNLRWVTRLENVLMNPITCKRVILAYGSIEAFLADPSNPKHGSLTTDFEWMRAVTPAEAEYSRQRMLAWANSDRPSRGRRLGDWVFRRESSPIEIKAPGSDLVASNTPGAVQRKWEVPAEFPLCPDPTDEAPLVTYLARLREEAVAVISPWGETRVGKAAMAENDQAVFVLGKQDGIKPWTLCKVTFEDGQFVHEGCGTFFGREGAEKRLALMQGLPWEGPETIDDYS